MGCKLLKITVPTHEERKIGTEQFTQIEQVKVIHKFKNGKQLKFQGKRLSIIKV